VFKQRVSISAAEKPKILKKFPMAAVEFVENPRTGRQVKVGTPTWKKLVREGTIPRPPNLTAKDLSQHSIEEFAHLPPPPEGQCYVRNKRTGEITTRRLGNRISTTRIAAEDHCKQMSIELTPENISWVENKISGSIHERKKQLEREKRRERTARRKYADEQKAEQKPRPEQIYEGGYSDDEQTDDESRYEEPRYANSESEGAGGWQDPPPRREQRREQPRARARPQQQHPAPRSREPAHRYPVRR
jgi:hypothetical protein